MQTQEEVVTTGPWDAIFIIMQEGMPTYPEWLAWHFACFVRGAPNHQSEEAADDEPGNSPADGAGDEPTLTCQ